MLYIIFVSIHLMEKKKNFIYVMPLNFMKNININLQKMLLKNIIFLRHFVYYLNIIIFHHLNIYAKNCIVYTMMMIVIFLLKYLFII